MGANEPKKKKRYVGKHFRPRFPRQKPRPAKLRPLTPWERDMAEEHHSLVLRFLQVHGLPMEDYYDVVIFRYLLAVENWSRKVSPVPGGFPAIAWAAMSIALTKEQERQRRIPQAVSLEEILPSDGMIFPNWEASLC